MILSTLCLVAAAFADDGHPLSLWELVGDTNRVYLLGSVHLLREQDYPLPSAIDRAYREADTLFMELDLDDLDPAAAQAAINRLGRIQDGRTLADWMGAEDYARAASLAAKSRIALPQLATAEPWFAAITVEQIMLTRIGFDPAHGVEAHLLGRAAADGKQIFGLENIEQQLGYLDRLSLKAQRALMLQSLEEATDIETMMEHLIRAWRHGDVEFLEEETLAEIARYPELYDALVVRRNRDWARQIDALLDDDQDYLIIVGTLHLVGDDSVQALLHDLGHTARQLHQPDD